MKNDRSIHRRVFHYAHTGIDILYRDLQISGKGYDTEQIEKRRRQYGSNLLAGRARDSVLYRLKRAFINDYNCGSAKKRNTVRSWLAQFQIPEEDEFFIRWNVVTVNLSAMVRKLEENNCSEHTLQMLWNAILFALYVDYDTKEDFMPQFEKAEEYLLNLCRKFRDMTMDQRPDTDGAETAANDLEPVNM